METFFNIICYLYTFFGEVNFMVFGSLKIFFNNFKSNLNNFFPLSIEFKEFFLYFQ